MKVTVIGLGKMGSVLAKRLLLAKFDLTVFNRTAEKMLALIQAGARGAATLEEAVKNADFVISCLFDDNSVLETAAGKAGFISFMKPGAIHIGTSTILPETSKRLSHLHETAGSIYLAANVLGVPKAAEKGELTTLVAGKAEAIESCQAIFKAYSSKIISVGPYPYQANVVKISMNYMLISAIETMGELYTFTEKSGVDIGLINTLFHSIYAHPAFKLYVDKIKERNFDEVNFELKGGLKDISLFQQAFIQAGVVPDLANLVKEKFKIAIEEKLEAKDWSAVTEVTRKQANLN